MASEPGAGTACAGAAGPPALAVTLFTDPLCCWSWGFEPQLRRLRYAFAGRLAWRVRMGGLVGDWAHYSDPVNAVERPGQLGPVWIHAAAMTGMPMPARIWVEDPPESSWPAALAVKAAEMLDPRLGDLVLRRLREALMLRAENIARPEIVRGVVEGLHRERPEAFSLAAFGETLEGGAAARALRDDVREARFRRIGRFPCLMLRRPDAPPAHVVGWRPYPALLDAVRTYAPDLGPQRDPPDASAYRRYWGAATERELQEPFQPGGDLRSTRAAAAPAPA